MSETNRPLLTIIIPTFNSDRILIQALESILVQTFDDYEVLIIDGKSTDQTLEIIKRFTEKDKRIRWLSEPDKGIYDAMNKGIQIAKGEWLYFLGSDDVLYDRLVLNDISKELKRNVDIVYGNVLFKRSQKIYDGIFNAIKLMEKNICHQALIFNKRVFVKQGLYDLKYKLLADYDHNIRWFNDNSIKRKYVNRVIAIYDEGGTSFSVNDEDFIKDKPLLYAKSFPLLIQFLFKNSDKKIIRLFINKFYAS